MAIKYIGYPVNSSQLHLALIGDGTSKTVSIDLTAMPFSFNFPKSNFPTGSRVAIEDGTAPQSITFSNAVMTLNFAQAPPAPQSGMISPRVQMTIYLIYG